MPYVLKQGTDQCAGFGVYKEETGELVAGGCHDEQDDALDHLAALHLATENERAIDPDGYETTNEMRAEAERALEWRAEYGRGGTAVGVARARDIKNGKRLPYDTVVRMRSFFARHEIDKQAEGFNAGEDGFPSAGRIAWGLWGGDSGKAWADRIVESVQDDENDDDAAAQRHVLAEGDDYTMARTEYRATVAQFTPDAADGYTYRGHVALFDSPSSPALGFTEVIKRGAFSKSLAAAGRQEWEIKAYQDHKPELFLGSTKTGTLSLVEDERGLLAEIKLNPAVSYASDLAANLRRDGAAMGASFGFSVPAKGERVSADGDTRELLNVRLHEVSLLTGHDPAYPATVGMGAVRALAQRTNNEATKVRDAIDALLAGELDTERAAFLRSLLGAVSHDAENVEESTNEQAPAESVVYDVPVRVRELQLALERMKR